MADEVPVSRIARRALNRMRDATVQVERWTQSKTPPPKRRGAPVQGRRWAKITGGEGGKYSHVAVKLDDDGRMTEDEEWGKGDHTKEGGWAVEARYRSKHVPNGAIVEIAPGPGRDCFLFDYTPGIVLARLPAEATITARTSTRPGSGMVELVKISEGADPNSETDDVFEGTGTQVKVYNSYLEEIGDAQAMSVQIAFGTSGRFWLVGVDC